MEQKVIRLNYSDAEPIAKEYFIEASGLDANTKSHQELLTEALKVLESCRSGIDIAGLLIPLCPDSFHDSAVFLGEKQFTCTAFQQIPTGKVKGIVAYLLSVGRCESKDKNEAASYYVELWSNAFLGAGRKLLRDEIKKSKEFNAEKSYVSDSFGPGFYGMPLDKISDLAKEIDGSMIGLAPGVNGELTKNRFSGGFFFITTEEGSLPAVECRDCIGHEAGCLFCGGRNLTPSKETCMELLRSYGTPPHVVRHCIAVAETAVRIAAALNKKGEDLDIPLLQASCLLHDIARVEENHGMKGAILVKKLGYHQVAKLIESHMFYATDPYKSRITEQDILCLADRMVKEDAYVGLDDRMQSVMDKLIAAGVDTERVRLRLMENRLIKERIETIIGNSIDDLMR